MNAIVVLEFVYHKVQKDLYDCIQMHTSGGGTDIRIAEAEADSSPPEDITRPLKRRPLADTRTDEVRAERLLPPDIWSDATTADDGAFFGLGHIPISDCASVEDAKSDAVDPSLECVSRPLKRKRSADTSTYGVRAKRGRTSGTLNDATKVEAIASFDLLHIPINDYTKIRGVEPDTAPAVALYIHLHAPCEAIARPPKRKRCADTTTDEMHDNWVRVRRGGGVLYPASRHASTVVRHDLRILWETNRLLMIPHPDHIDHPDTRPVYTYHVIAENERPLDSGTPQDYTIIPLATTAACSYRSLGWHELSANLHLMTIRVGREFIKRPLHYEHSLPIDALVHIPIITLVHPDAVEPVSPYIEQESSVEGISRLQKRKRSPDTDTDEVFAKRMRTSVIECNASNVEDGVPFGPHPRCMITGCVSADVEACYILPPNMPQLLMNRKIDYITFNMRTNYNALRCHIPANIIFLRRDFRELWETNRLLIIPHSDHLKKSVYGTVYKCYVVAEDEHPPDSCATMGHPVTPSLMTAPCSYRSLGCHELNINLRLMIFRAGQKLSKRPLHYQHVLRALLPHQEVDHAYSIVDRYELWTIPVPHEMVPNRRLWETGEISACPDDYYDWPEKQYCSPLLDDDTVRFPRPFRPIVSGIKRKHFGDTNVGTEAYTAEKYAQQEVSIRQWCLDCDQARDEWTMGPPAEPEDAAILAYRQEEAGDVLPIVQKLCSVESYFSRSSASRMAVCWRTTLVGEPRRLAVMTGDSMTTSANRVILVSPILADKSDVLLDRAQQSSAIFGNSGAMGYGDVRTTRQELLAMRITRLILLIASDAFSCRRW
ncbi:predicted protein [Postia placenta Mad-698-R]|uniref:Uncharacterized protein n=1 Tax=Postia placenta MAD-698-R-SB12 TaxID=670580 RepID=A0A1X6N5E0_9APHY|nr:hypothetical protein POSPLADRAFT_1139929 [Postia placenta MAD-698-R-SB12]EED84938.1 predicted protein [Postia placenta Mad-698-R]OSX63643.1 hypothetical protein POSPLADRAFT_1139929 [Postia placenta MAD-698-R-SB12]